METPPLPWCGLQGSGCTAQLALLVCTGDLLARTPSHCPGLQPLCSLPLHLRPGLRKCVAWWAGAGSEEGALDSQLQEEQAGGANQLPACLEGVGAWVGFRFRRGCDCKARKLQKSPD